MSAAGKYGMRLFPDLVRVAAGIHFGSESMKLFL